jgi:hypothetical protein
MTLKSTLHYLLLMAGILLAGFFGPWWAPAVFIVLYSALWGKSAGHAALAGGLMLGVAYLGLSIWSVTADQAGILEKTGLLMGGLSSTALILFTVFIGWVTGALSGWMGSGLGGLFKGM